MLIGHDGTDGTSSWPAFILLVVMVLCMIFAGAMFKTFLLLQMPLLI